MVVMPISCGLYVIRDSAIRAVPLTKCNVTAVVRDWVAQVTLEQTFVNSENVKIEATYLFPIHPAGAVNKFQVTVQDGRKYEGVIKSKGDAKQQYKEALQSGHGAYMLEQTENSEQIFQCSVGNLESGQHVTITIGYVCIVENDDAPDSLRFVVPTTIAPRYSPAGKQARQTASEVSAGTSASRNESGSGSGSGSESVQAEYSVSVPYSVLLDLQFEMTNKIKSIVSPSHAIVTHVSEDGTQGKVSFTVNGEQLDRDIVVVLSGQDLDDPVVLVERLGGADESQSGEHSDNVCAMLSFVPRFNTKEQASEMIFLIDTSGSMSGFKIEQAKAALNLLLRSLPVDCYFNVYEFDYQFKSLFHNSVKYSQETLHSAINFANQLSASGGTELLKPLQQIQSNTYIPGYKRQLIILTDGEVSNVQEVLSSVRVSSNSMRVFTIGIGNAVSHELVDGIAKAANGTAVYIMENESFSKKVVQQLQRAVQPAFTNLKVQWPLLEQGAATTSSTDEDNNKGKGKGNDKDKEGKATSKASEAEAEAEAEQQLSFFVKSLKQDATATASSDSDSKATIGKVRLGIGSLVKQVPFVSGPIFKGARYTAFAIGSKLALDSHKAVVTGTDGDGRTFTLQVEHKADEQRHTLTGSLVHSIAARKLIEELSAKTSYLHAEAGCSEADVKAVIEQLGLQYNLVSSETAFVCIEEREAAAWRKLSVAQKRNVPILGDAHGGVGPSVGVIEPRPRPPIKHCVFGAMSMRSAAPMASARFGQAPGLSAAPKALLRSCVAMPEARNVQAMSIRSIQDQGGLDCIPVSDYFSFSVGTSAAKPSTDNLQTLLCWQLFDGSFTLNAEFCRFVANKSLEDTVAAARRLLEANDSVKDAWRTQAEANANSILATVLALGYLVSKLRGRKAEWDMVADKAVSYLSRLKQLSRSEYEALATSLLNEY